MSRLIDGSVRRLVGLLVDWSVLFLFSLFSLFRLSPSLSIVFAMICTGTRYLFLFLLNPVFFFFLFFLCLIFFFFFF